MCGHSAYFILHARVVENCCFNLVYSRRPWVHKKLGRYTSCPVATAIVAPLFYVTWLTVHWFLLCDWQFILLSVIWLIAIFFTVYRYWLRTVFLQAPFSSVFNSFCFQEKLNSHNNQYILKKKAHISCDDYSIHCIMWFLTVVHVYTIHMLDIGNIEMLCIHCIYYSHNKSHACKSKPYCSHNKGRACKSKPYFISSNRKWHLNIFLP